MTDPKLATRPARELYRALVAEYAPSTSERALLIEALRALDRAESARLAVGDQLTVTDRVGGLKAHPLLTVERDSRAAFTRLMRQLGLGDATPPRELPLATGTAFPRGRGRTRTS